jgi:hypothetical protein
MLTCDVVVAITPDHIRGINFCENGGCCFFNSVELKERGNIFTVRIAGDKQISRLLLAFHDILYFKLFVNAVINSIFQFVYYQI